ncbi:MAG: efflux RND transporter periplasmic adaptor subunit [Bacteroidales bacterium]|nr:efflux RND transporter periplasmic adaptor subunit [Bacteroidales bacterium]
MNKLQIIGWAAIFALLLSSCSPQPKEEQKEEKSAQPVKTMILKMDSLNREIQYTANLTAYEEVYFAPSQPGRINSIYVEAGDRVRKGQKLVKMDQTQLTQALLQLEQARTNFRRMDTLYKLNSISEQQYDQAKTQYEIALSNLEYLKENTKLMAPFNGIITEKYYEAGEVYSGAPNTQAGKAAIVTLMQISPLKAVVSISEKYFPNIKEGMLATVRSDIYPNQTFQGSVLKVYPVINPATRSFKTEIKVNNPQEKLRPGMFAKVNIKLKDDAAMFAPAISIVKQEGTNNRYVFVVEDGKARKINVKLGERKNENIELLSDEIEKGMELIIAGQANLMHGDKVKVKN